MRKAEPEQQVDYGALELLTVKDVAKLMRLSEPTIWRRVASGDLESVKDGRSRRIPRESMLAYKNKLRGLDPEGKPLSADQQSPAA